MHIVFQLCDVLRFDSAVFINVLINISREVLGIVPHFSLAPASSPHVSASPI